MIQAKRWKRKLVLSLLLMTASAPAYATDCTYVYAGRKLDGEMVRDTGLGLNGQFDCKARGTPFCLMTAVCDGKKIKLLCPAIRPGGASTSWACTSNATSCYDNSLLPKDLSKLPSDQSAGTFGGGRGGGS